LAGALLAGGLQAGALHAQQPPQAAERPAIVGIARVAFRVSAIDAAREFYGHILGIPPAPSTATAAAKSASASGACVRFYVNARQEIALEPGLPPDEEERLSFLAFETPSVEAFATYLTSHGITPESHIPTTPCQ